MSNEQKPSAADLAKAKIVSGQAVEEYIKNNADWQAKPKDDLTILFESFALKCKNVQQLSNPVIITGIENNSIHSPEGRKQHMLKVHKLFLENFKDYSYEELLFLLAYTHAKLLMEEHV